jgi:hypothetical protein
LVEQKMHDEYRMKLEKILGKRFIIF